MLSGRGGGPPWSGSGSACDFAVGRNEDSLARGPTTFMEGLLERRGNVGATIVRAVAAAPTTLSSLTQAPE